MVFGWLKRGQDDKARAGLKQAQAASTFKKAWLAAEGVAALQDYERSNSIQEAYAAALLACLRLATTGAEVEQASLRLFHHPQFRSSEHLHKLHFETWLDVLPGQGPVSDCLPAAEVMSKNPWFASQPYYQHAQAYYLCAQSSRTECPSQHLEMIGMILRNPGTNDLLEVQVELAKTISNASGFAASLATGLEMVEGLQGLSHFSSDVRLREAYARALANVSHLASDKGEAGKVANRIARLADYATSEFLQTQAARCLLAAATLEVSLESANQFSKFIANMPMYSQSRTLQQMAAQVPELACSRNVERFTRPASGPKSPAEDAPDQPDAASVPWVVVIQWVGRGITDQGIDLTIQARSEAAARKAANLATENLLAQNRAQLEDMLGIQIRGFEIVELRRA